MKLPSYLHVSRHHVFVFRRRVPNDLRAHFNSDELRCSLRTKSKQDAVRVARAMALKTDLVFEELRAMGKKTKDDVIQADLIYEMDFLDLGRRIVINYDPAKAGEKEEADRRISETQALMKSVAIPTVAGLVTAGAPTLSAMVDAFLSENEILRRRDKPATVRKDKDALALFQQVAGRETPIRQVSQAQAIEFEQLLESRGLAPNTKNNHMGAVSKFSNWVHGRHREARHDKLDFSTLRFKVDKRADEQRAAFTVPEVKLILEDERLIEFRVPEPEKFWLPYIAAYSAMRVEEIAQLDPASDFIEDGGVWLFDVNDENGKQLKNKTSVRKVPIHPALIKLGILTYVEELRQRGARQLFPNVRAAQGRLAKNASKTVNRFIRLQMGIAKSLHSFRHTVATLLKQMRVEEALAAAILGHAHGGITYARYGKDHLPSVLHDEAIAKITYGLAIERND